MLSKLRPVIFVLTCVAVICLAAGFILKIGPGAAIHYRLHQWSAPGFGNNAELCTEYPALWEIQHTRLSRIGRDVLLISGAALLVLGIVWIHAKPLSSSRRCLRCAHAGRAAMLCVIPLSILLWLGPGQNLHKALDGQRIFSFIPECCDHDTPWRHHHPRVSQLGLMLLLTSAGSLCLLQLELHRQRKLLRESDTKEVNTK